jgi:hypothetical protein
VILRPHRRKENQCIMNRQQSTSISGKPHPENHKGEGSKPSARRLVEQTTMPEGYSRATAFTAASVVGRPASSASVTGFTGGRRR